MPSRLFHYLLTRLPVSSISLAVSVADITELVSLTGLTDGQVVHVRDPHRGGTFVFTTGETQPPDDGTVFDAANVAGVFTRQGTGFAYSPKWWGAIGDGAHDDTRAFADCIEAVERANDNPTQPYLGKSGNFSFQHNTAYVDITPGIYRITSTLTLRNASIIGRSKSSCVIFHDIDTAGDLFSSPYTEYPITGADCGPGTAAFQLADDLSSVFKKDFLFEVVGSTANDGTYTVHARGASYANNVLTIPVNGPIDSASVNGSIRVYSGPHYATDIHNLTLVGSGTLVENFQDPRELLNMAPEDVPYVRSNRAINLYQAIWGCSIANVIISQFQVGVCARNCWCFRIEDSMIFNCPRCLEWYGAVSVDCANTRFEACYSRVVGISDHGVYIGRGSAPPQSVSFTGCCFQGAGKVGVCVDGATNIVFNSCLFERNDLEDAGNAYVDIRPSVGPTTAATFTGCIWTPARSAAKGSLCLDLAGVRDTNLIGCEMRDGTNGFANSIRADSHCDAVNLLGTRDATQRKTDLDSSVSLKVL